MGRHLWHHGWHRDRWVSRWEQPEYYHHRHCTDWSGVYATWFGGGGWGDDCGCW